MSKIASRVETLVWVLLYGGLLAAVLGVFVVREDGGAAIGHALWIVGGLAAAGGVVLIVLRSRMEDRR
jgi:hypothetical protein